MAKIGGNVAVGHDNFSVIKPFSDGCGCVKTVDGEKYRSSVGPNIARAAIFARQIFFNWPGAFLAVLGKGNGFEG